MSTGEFLEIRKAGRGRNAGQPHKRKPASVERTRHRVNTNLFDALTRHPKEHRNAACAFELHGTLRTGSRNPAVGFAFEPTAALVRSIPTAILMIPGLR